LLATGRLVVGGSWFPRDNIYSNIHPLNADGHIEQLPSATKGHSNVGKVLAEFIGGLAYLPDGTLLVSDINNHALRTLAGLRMTDWLGLPGHHDDAWSRGRVGNLKSLNHVIGVQISASQPLSPPVTVGVTQPSDSGTDAVSRFCSSRAGERADVRSG
jgi:hypothetical protein